MCLKKERMSKNEQFFICYNVLLNGLKKYLKKILVIFLISKFETKVGKLTILTIVFICL